MKVIAPCPLTGLYSNIVEYAGPWSSGHSYAVGDNVGYLGMIYCCVVAISGTATPNIDSTHWLYVYPQEPREWASNTLYAVDDLVLCKLTDNCVYRCITAHTSTSNGLPPHDQPITNELTGELTNSTDWLYVRPSNKWAMFDGSISTASSRSHRLAVQFSASDGLSGKKINAIAMFGLIGSKVEIWCGPPSNVNYWYKSFNLTLSVVDNWYSYFFGTIDPTASIFSTDLPSFDTATISVVITNDGGTASCGLMAAGHSVDLGMTNCNAKIGIMSYSVKNTDSYGVTSFAKGPNSKKLSVTAIIDNTLLDSTYQTMASLDATPCAWIATDQYSAFSLFGFYRDFSIEVTYPTKSLISFEIEGLI